MSPPMTIRDQALLGQAGAGGCGIEDTDLKTYWKFNEASGDIINNSEASADLGSGADLQVTGADYQTGSPPLGQSMNFEGTDSAENYALAGSSLSQFNFMHNSTAKWTTAWWSKATTRDTTFTYFATDRSTSKNGVSIHGNTNASMSMLMYNGGTPYPIQSQSGANFIPDTTTWHFYVMTYDYSLGSDNLVMKRDNANAYTDDNDAGSHSDGNAGYVMRIGRKPDYTEDYLDGEINESSIWDKVMSDEDQTSLYNGGSGLAIY